VIGVRTDFYVHCIELRGLAPLLADASVPVEMVSEDELREVITEPARRVGLSVERALITRIVAEAAGQRGALPWCHMPCSRRGGSDAALFSLACQDPDRRRCAGAVRRGRTTVALRRRCRPGPSPRSRVMSPGSSAK
jgi:conflict system STAND superfamily ATPase